MKRMLVFFLLLIVFSAHFQTISAAFYEEKPPSEEMIQRVTVIFEARVDIWNSLLDPLRETDLKGISKELRSYMVDPLLKVELELYQNMIEDPTSYEKIVGLRISESSVLEGTHNSKKIFMNILWELEGYDGITHESVNYIVEMKKIKETWFLVDYQVVLYNN